MVLDFPANLSNNANAVGGDQAAPATRNIVSRGVQKQNIVSLNVNKQQLSTGSANNNLSIYSAGNNAPVYKIKKSQIINHADIKNFDMAKKNIQNGETKQIKEISNFSQRKDSVTFKSKLIRQNSNTDESKQADDINVAVQSRNSVPAITNSRQVQISRDNIEQINFTRNTLVGLNTKKISTNIKDDDPFKTELKVNQNAINYDMLRSNLSSSTSQSMQRD